MTLHSQTHLGRLLIITLNVSPILTLSFTLTRLFYRHVAICQSAISFCMAILWADKDVYILGFNFAVFSLSLPLPLSLCVIFRAFLLHYLAAIFLAENVNGLFETALSLSLFFFVVACASYSPLNEHTCSISPADVSFVCVCVCYQTPYCNHSHNFALPLPLNLTLALIPRVRSLKWRPHDHPRTTQRRKRRRRGQWRTIYPPIYM